MVASRVLRLLGIAGVLLVVLCAYTPLPTLLSHRTGQPAPLASAEAIVVLGGAVNAQGVPTLSGRGTWTPGAISHLFAEERV